MQYRIPAERDSTALADVFSYSTGSAVSIDGRTLYFYDVFSSTVPVVIVDSNDEVVFSDYLYCGADKIMLPASLTGTFTVYMRVGTILYYGTFNV